MSLSRAYLDNIIRELSIEYGVGQRDLTSMINSVFKFFLAKMTNFRDNDVINMPGLGRFYMGQVAKRNKSRWVYIHDMLLRKLDERNIKYENE